MLFCRRLLPLRLIGEVFVYSRLTKQDERERAARII